MTDRILDNFLWIVLGLLLLLAGWYFVAEIGEIGDFARECAHAGGHIYQPDDSSWCLTEDGRFVEVYP